jgi:hypothetical protein
MPFPEEVASHIEGKNLTLRVSDEQGKYQAGKIYDIGDYKGNPWGKRIKVLSVDTMPIKDYSHNKGQNTDIKTHKRYGPRWNLAQDFGNNELVDIIKFQTL